MTAASVVARAVGMVVPLAFMYLFKFPPTVIAFWLLVTTFQSVVGGINGSLPTLSMQMLSYAQAGSKSIFGSMEDHRSNSQIGPNLGLTAHINRALVGIYDVIQLIWIATATIIGTAIIWSSLLTMPSVTEASTMWAIFIVLSAIRLRSQPYISYLFAIGKTAYARRLEAFAWLGGAAITAISFVVWGNIAFAMFSLYMPVVVQLVLAKREAIASGWQNDCPEREEYQDYNIARDIWPRAWRGTFGIMAGMIILYGGGFIFAQYGDPVELAGYLLALNILGILQQIAISPLYGALPAMANCYAGGKKESLLGLTDHVMKRSNWLFSITVVAVPPAMMLANTALGLDIHFISVPLWAAMCSATFILRYGGGHLAIYTISNHIILHWVNGLYAVLYLVPLILLRDAPLLYYPLVQCAAGIIYACIARYLTLTKMDYPLSRDSGFTLTAFVFILTFFWLIDMAVNYF